jgi:SAM-dependent methyltransferase
VTRLLGITVAFVGLLALTGCPMPVAKPTAPTTPVAVQADASDTSLVLRLPGSLEPHPQNAHRVPKLTIDGKEEPVKTGEDREVTVPVPNEQAGKTVKIVYSYWPYYYSNTIRTKEVKVEAGKRIVVDFHVEDPKHPDLIKPIYYPTPHAVVDEMCKMAKVDKDDIVYDIGCGDGRVVIGAVKRFGAKKGVGVDIDPDLIKECNKNATAAGVGDRLVFRNENALTMKDLSEATVVLLYVGEDFGAKLEPVLRKTLKPGARVVSHRFPLGDWEPDSEVQITAKNNDDRDEQYILKLWTIKPRATK